MYTKDNKLKIQSLFEKINLLSKKINNDEVISSLEIDLLKSHLIVLYDLVQDFGNTNTESIQIEIKEEVKIAPKPSVVEIAEDKTEIIVEEEPDFYLSETKEEIIPQPIEVPVAKETEVVIEEAKVNIEEKKITAKQISSSLNDLFTTVDSTPKSTSLSKSESIRAFISINDKLLFISDLFNGDPNAYNNAIDRLDSFLSPDDAVDYINEEIATKYDWIDKEQEAELFFSIIKRKINY